MAIKETKLFIEKNKTKEEYQVLVTIGKFTSICMTKSVNFDADNILDNISELEDVYYGVDNRTLH